MLLHLECQGCVIALSLVQKAGESLPSLSYLAILI